MKKLLVILVLGALGSLALLYGVGAAQPVDHRASVRAPFAASQEEIWAVITDFEAYPAWNPAFVEVRRTGDVGGKPCWIYEGEFGPMPTVIDTLEAPAHMVTRIAPEADIGFEGTWSYTLEPAADGGCVLTLVEDGSVLSPLFRGMGVFFFDHHDAMTAFLTDLGLHLGEAISPEIVRVESAG
jgi:hypothetical protein